MIIVQVVIGQKAYERSILTKFTLKGGISRALTLKKPFQDFQVPRYSKDLLVTSAPAPLRTHYMDNTSIACGTASLKCSTQQLPWHGIQCLVHQTIGVCLSYLYLHLYLYTSINLVSFFILFLSMLHLQLHFPLHAHPLFHCPQSSTRSAQLNYWQRVVDLVLLAQQSHQPLYARLASTSLHPIITRYTRSTITHHPPLNSSQCFTLNYWLNYHSARPDITPPNGVA